MPRTPNVARRVEVVRRLVSAATVAVVWSILFVWQGPEEAAALEPGKALEDRLAATTEADAGADGAAGLLARRDAHYEGMLAAERLPRTGSYLTEVQIEWNDRQLRLPVRVSRGDEGEWTISWMPDRAYLEALVDLVGDGGPVSLPQGDAKPWVKPARMPAFPIVLADGRATTALGPVSLSEEGVEPPERLGKYIERWIDRVLEGDPAPAAIEIVASGDTTWRELTQVLFGAASAGMFRVHLVGRSRDADGLVGVSVLAPVFESGRRPDGSKSFVAGMYGTLPAAIRLVAAGERLGKGTSECSAEQMSLCVEQPSAFASEVPALVRSAFPDRAPTIRHVLFAATGDLALSDTLPYALRLPGALGIPTRKLYLGHIGDRQTGGER